MKSDGFEDRTLSAIDLAKTDDLVKSLSTLSSALALDIDGQKAAIDKARARCHYYAPKSCEHETQDCIYHVDLKQFTDGLAQSQLASPAVKQLAQGVSDHVHGIVIDRYGGPERDDGYGSYGLAIYFPATHDEYACDPVAPRAYYRSNDDNPVAFVADKSVTWVDFLQAYLKVKDGAACGQ